MASVVLRGTGDPEQTAIDQEPEQRDGQKEFSLGCFGAD